MEAKKSHTTASSKAHNFNSTSSKNLRESHLGEATNDFINDGKRVANELYEEGRNRIYEVQNNIKDYSSKVADKVYERPITSLLIAGGIGYILSALFHRR
ncbi:hypothetical protein [Legionella cardiaca]|uniref:DUF883 domain-containing protein n=1 Tax=Legionella cardiaca TaxID=1071983 RepID=A0ABY8AUH0_9GAMM|nr:hypothetical protein [Legionella cardiaca]WED44228.1 hypothetical protein PXX05_05425 [Legionella cardiaca]